MLRKKNDEHDNATDACDRPLDAKSNQSRQTQVKQKAQIFLSTDNGLDIGDLAFEKQNLLTLISLMQILLVF